MECVSKVMLSSIGRNDVDMPLDNFGNPSFIKSQWHLEPKTLKLGSFGNFVFSSNQEIIKLHNTE